MKVLMTDVVAVNVTSYETVFNFITGDKMQEEKRKPGRPRKYNSNAERQRAYRERVKSQGKRGMSRAAGNNRGRTSPEVAELRRELDAARNEILYLRLQLACFTEVNRDSGKTWSIQERKGNARWQTVEKGLSRRAAESRLDKLAASVSTSRYTYRMIEE